MKPLMSLYGTEWRERDYGLWYVHTLCTLHEQYCIMHVLVLSIPAASTDDIYKFRFISVYLCIRLLACQKTPAPHYMYSYSFSNVHQSKKPNIKEKLNPNAVIDIIAVLLSRFQSIFF